MAINQPEIKPIIRTYLTEISLGYVLCRQNPKMTFIVTGISLNECPVIKYERIEENKNGLYSSTKETGIISDLTLRRVKNSILAYSRTENKLISLGNIHQKPFNKIILNHH